MMTEPQAEIAGEQETQGAAWQPLEATDRRVLGVLVEKAKTTPDSYPLTLNALRNGCNQKSNRFPQMQLEEDRIEDSLERLRGLGATTIVQGEGRAEKFRHRAYEWLGVDKVELAVMAELLLRGAQTIGELRGRAARMEPIKGLEELKPVLASLEAKKLIIFLSPKGRGAIVSHALYLDRELEKVRRDAGISAAATSAPNPSHDPPHRPAEATGSPSPPPAAVDTSSSIAQVEKLTKEVKQLQLELTQTREEFAATIEMLEQDVDQMKQQLGI